MMNERDYKVLWHPFTQHGLESEFLPVIAGQGAWLQLNNNKKVIDAISSWWVNLHGHAHPLITQAICKQAEKLEHVIFAGCTHEPAILLAELLIAATQARNAHLTRCFYSDNGSTAVEIAMKMAYQYHFNNGNHARTDFIVLSNSYHGDTLGCMTLSARHSFHKAFDKILPPVDTVPTNNIEILKELLRQKSQQYAAIIIEPLVQAATGMHMYSAEFLTELASICQQEKILLICDEAFTGFYRTGTCFAFEQASIKPDILCLAKGLTGGFLPLAVTLTTEKIYNAFFAKEIDRAFLHGHTYTANPLACAAAIASWHLLQQPATQTAINFIAQKTQQWIDELSQHSQVTEARALGTIGAVNIKNAPDYFSDFAYKIRSLAIEQGVLLRPLGATLYAVPPYCVTVNEIDHIYGTMKYILNQVACLL